MRFQQEMRRGNARDISLLPPNRFSCSVMNGVVKAGIDVGRLDYL
jgi:hypothetical protein